MFGLFASIVDVSETATPVLEKASMFPDNFWQGLLGSSIYALLALVLFPLFWKIIDWVTPGDLNGQLLGTMKSVAHTPDGKPNMALAVVVGLMALGFCVILASAIH